MKTIFLLSMLPFGTALIAMAADRPNTSSTAKESRFFEMRTYYAAPGKLDDLNARFRNHTLQLFEKHGMTNIGYWTPADKDKGADHTLVYLLAHKSKQSAEASFKSFREDPDWIAAKKASEDKAGGSLTVPDGV